MKIFIGTDHRGFALKNQLVSWLEETGHQVIDNGANKLDQDDDYPDYGISVALAVAKEPDSRGIVICGSGLGMSVIADKVASIRAAFTHNPEIIKAGRNDDDINVLALGADYIDFESAKAVVKSFLETPFAGEPRHQRRLAKISDYEQSKNNGQN